MGKVAADGKFLAIVSTVVETDAPEAELEAGLKILGDIEDKFVDVSDTFEPKEDGSKDKCFISKSYDSTSHFETTSTDVLALYKRITGEDCDLSPKKRSEEET